MNKIKLTVFRYIALSCFGLTATVSSAAAKPDVNALIKKAEQVAYYTANDGRSQARMMIVDKQGRKQYRQFTILRKDVEDNGDQKLMVFFNQPADVRGTVFRVEKRAASQEDDDRWLYLPALDLVKRISAGDKRTSFVGSHFYYEDVSGRAISEDNFSLLGEDADQYILRGEPKNPVSVEFAHYLVHINKETYLPMLIEFFDNKGEMYRKTEVVKVANVQGYPTVIRSKISDLKSEGFTLMEFRQPQYNLGLPDSVFSERSLRTPPKAWFK